MTLKEALEKAKFALGVLASFSGEKDKGPFRDSIGTLDDAIEGLKYELTKERAQSLKLMERAIELCREVAQLQFELNKERAQSLKRAIELSTEVAQPQFELNKKARGANDKT